MGRAAAAGLACLLASCAGGGTGGGGQAKPGCTPPPGGPTISFKSVIQPIFDRSCAFSGPCHAPPVPQGPGLDLSAGHSCKSAVNVKSAEVPSLRRVKPGDPNGSYLVQKIRGDPGIVQAIMPQGCPVPPIDSRARCLTSDEIQAIVQWVTECAPCNN